MSREAFQLLVLSMTHMNCIYTHIPQLDVLSAAARKCYTLMPKHDPVQGATQDCTYLSLGERQVVVERMSKQTHEEMNEQSNEQTVEQTSK